MTIQELIQRERISAKDLRAEMGGLIDSAITKWIDRLNDLERRLELEALTGGKPTFPAEEKKEEKKEPEVIEAEHVAPSVNGPKTA